MIKRIALLVLLLLLGLYVLFAEVPGGLPAVRW